MKNLQELHSDFCNYSEYLKGNTPDTITWLKAGITNYQKFSCVEYPKDVTRISLEDWILHGRAQRNWKAKTVHTYLRAVSLFLDWCVQRNHLKTNPSKEIPRPKLEKKIPQYLTESECDTILYWAKNYPYHYKLENPRNAAIISTFLAGFSCIKVRNAT